MRIDWTLPARRSLATITEYIAQDDPVAAVALDDAILGHVAALGDHPRLGRVGRVEGTRELVIASNYLVVYCIDEESGSVSILQVLHAKLEWP